MKDCLLRLQLKVCMKDLCDQDGINNGILSLNICTTFSMPKEI